MVVFGYSPGVSLDLIGGGVQNTVVGTERKLVVFGRGDPTAAASPNEPINASATADFAEEFGRGSELQTQLEKASLNGANDDFLYGVMPEEVAVTGETIDGSGTLANAPIVESLSAITVTKPDGGGGTTDVDVNFGFDDPPTQPSSGLAINPESGQATGADDTVTYTVSYPYLDWQAALDAADGVLNHYELGVYQVLSEAESVASALSAKLDELRPTWKMISGFAGAQPNATNTDGEATVDADAYSDNLDNGALFAPIGVRLQGNTSPRTVLGGIGGMAAGHGLENPIYGDTIQGYGALTQQFSLGDNGELNTLLDQQVIPILDSATDGEGGITIESNQSTSTATDWARTFQNRRIADVVLLMIRRHGEAARDELAGDLIIDETKQRILDEFEDLARRNLIAGSPDTAAEGGQNQNQDSEDNQPFYCEVTRADNSTINIAAGFRPTGVIKDVSGQIVVDTTLDGVTATV